MIAVTRHPDSPAVCPCGSQLDPCGHDGPTAYYTCPTCNAFARVTVTAAETPGLFDDRDYAAPDAPGRQDGLF